MKSLDKGISKRRSYRCPDKLYNSFVASAKKNDEQPSMLIRKFIETYINKNRR